MYAIYYAPAYEWRVEQNFGVGWHFSLNFQEIYASHQFQLLDKIRVADICLTTLRQKVSKCENIINFLFKNAVKVKMLEISKAK